MVGSACNYGYGTIDPIERALRPRARARHRPARRRLPRRVHPAVGPGARLRHPAVRLPRPGRHVDLGRHAQVRLRLQGHVGARVPRQGAAQQPVLLHDRLDRREVRVARHRGLAFRRPARGDVGGDGEHRPRRATCEYAKRIFETAFAMQDAVRSHPELRIIGNPTFCFSFTSDEFDIYHVNDFMRTKGWRFNGQQYPNAIHMAVTRPQTQPGLRRRVRRRPRRSRRRTPTSTRTRSRTSGAIYGGVEGGMTDEADEFIRVRDGRHARQAPGPASALNPRPRR